MNNIHIHGFKYKKNKKNIKRRDQRNKLKANKMLIKIPLFRIRSCFSRVLQGHV